MVVVHNDAFEPVIWERSTGRLTSVQVPAGSYVAENSDVRWTNDGRSIVFALHSGRVELVRRRVSAIRAPPTRNAHAAEKSQDRLGATL